MTTTPICTTADKLELEITIEGDGFTIRKYRDSQYPDQRTWCVTREGYDEDKQYSNACTEETSWAPLSPDSYSAYSTIVIPRVAVEGNNYGRNDYSSDEEYEARLVRELFTPIELPLLSFYTEIDGAYHPTHLYDLTQEEIVSLLTRRSPESIRRWKAKKAGLVSREFFSLSMCWWDWNDMRIVTKAEPQYQSVEEYIDTHPDNDN